MSKLQHNGIRGVMMSWFKSYLSNILIGNNMSQSKTPAPLCQSLHYMYRKDRCRAQYFLFSTSMTCIDPKTSCALLIC